MAVPGKVSVGGGLRGLIELRRDESNTRTMGGYVRRLWKIFIPSCHEPAFKTSQRPVLVGRHRPSLT
jgi:hypothetical protein